MYNTEGLITIMAAVGTLVAVFIAMLLFQGVAILRSMQRRSLRSQTQRVLKEDHQERGRLRDVLDHITVDDPDWSMLRKDGAFIFELGRALDYAESVALGVKYGIYDERMIRDAYGQLFVALRARSEGMIDAARYKMNSPDLYAAFSSLVDEWLASARHRRRL